MLKHNNPEFVIQRLAIVHFTHDGKTVFYELDYLEDDVERMLAHYKKEIIKEERKARRKRIEF